MNKDQLIAAGVAGCAFAASAEHIYAVAVVAGNPPVIAGVHPVAIDMLIYIGIRAISASKRWEGWLATSYGVVMSLVFNAVSYAHVPMPPWVMAFAMPVSLILAVLVVGHDVVVKAEDVPEVVPARVPRRRVHVPAVVSDVPMSDVPAVVSNVPTPAMSLPSSDVPARKSRVVWDKDLAVKLLSEGQLSHKDIADRVGCDRKTIDRLAARQ